jgi:predicted MPP superfamily phosphohydrolase
MASLARGVAAMAGLGLLGAGALAAQARHVAPYRPVLERVALPVPAGHAALAGLRIGFVTDAHVGPSFSAADLARATALLIEQRPDLVLLGGDYISEATRYIDGAAAVLADLVQAAPLGGYAVLGNHDMHHGGRPVATALERCGIPVLRNRAVEVESGHGRLWVAGIDESLVARPDPVGTFARIPSGAAALALWHEPAGAAQVARLGAFGQLSGHSHGGQIRLPIIGPLVLPPHGRTHAIGWNRAAGMPVYTSRGVGVYRPPLRFRCPPEVTLVALVAPGEASRGSAPNEARGDADGAYPTTRR